MLRNTRNPSLADSAGISQHEELGWLSCDSAVSALQQSTPVSTWERTEAKDTVAPPHKLPIP